MAMSVTQAIVGRVEEIGLGVTRMASMVREGAYAPVARPDRDAIGGSKQLAPVDTAQGVGYGQRVVHGAKRVDHGIETHIGHTAAYVVGETATENQQRLGERDAYTAGAAQDRSGPLELRHGASLRGKGMKSHIHRKSAPRLTARRHMPFNVGTKDLFLGVDLYPLDKKVGISNLAIANDIGTDVDEHLVLWDGGTLRINLYAVHTPHDLL